MLQDLLQTPGLVTGLISLAIIIVTALLRDRIGETEADRVLKQGEAASLKAELILEAALAAVTEVEKSLKEKGDMSNDQLKNAAVAITADMLEGWGIKVDDALIRVLFAIVENAYQGLKPSFALEKAKA